MFRARAKRRHVGVIAALTAGLVLVAGTALASDASIVDITNISDPADPVSSVSLLPGGSQAISINISVSGAQAGNATFTVYRDWELSGGTFTGSNPQTFSVPGPRTGSSPALLLSATGSVSVASGHDAGGPHSLVIGVFDITNTNDTGAKLAAGTAGTYSVTVLEPTPSDTTPPSIECDSGPSGWQADNVTISCTASDSGSGLANAADANFSLSTSVAAGSETNGAMTNSRTVYDNEGNPATAGPLGPFWVDRKSPSVTCGAAPTFTLGQAGAEVSATVTDGGSGPAASPVSAAANTSSVGAKTASLTGYDNVGNSASADCGYKVIYNWTGFFRPVDNLPTLNSVKAGSAVPLKFSLSGNQGLGIMAASSPSSQKINCDSSAPIDAVEETVTAGSSSLQYDASLDQYTYVWKTDKAWAGTCRTLKVTLIDGQSYSASFKLLK